MRYPAGAEIQDAAARGKVVGVVGAQAGDGGGVDVRDEARGGVEGGVGGVVEAGEGGGGVGVGGAGGGRAERVCGIVWRGLGRCGGGHGCCEEGWEGEREEETPLGDAGEGACHGVWGCSGGGRSGWKGGGAGFVNDVYIVGGPGSGSWERLAEWLVTMDGLRR